MNGKAKYVLSKNQYTEITEGCVMDREKLIKYFDTYLHNIKDDWNYITPTELHEQMAKSPNYCFLLDVRDPKDWRAKHIKGTVNIYWLELFKSENIKRLPKECMIVIICYLGHTASQILTLLKLIGYNAVVLKFGMGASPKKSVPIAGWNQLSLPTESTKKIEV